MHRTSGSFIVDRMRMKIRDSRVREGDEVDLRKWSTIVAPYARADHRRAVMQLLNTGLPFLVLIAALMHGMSRYPWLTFPLTLPAVFLLVRLFIIQPHCGHRSFFQSLRAVALLGRTL